MPEQTLDEMYAESPARLAAHLGTVTLPAVPSVLALYDAADPTRGTPAAVRAWVLVTPDRAPIVVDAEDPRRLARPRDLDSLAVRWSALIGGDLTAVTAG